MKSSEAQITNRVNDFESNLTELYIIIAKISEEMNSDFTFNNSEK